jgi:ATP:ADP antiporter, AAA family
MIRKPEEVYGVFLSSYYVMRPLRDQLAAEAGSASLPWFFAATLVATALITPLFSLAASKWPRRIVIPCVYLVVIISQASFIPFFISHDLISPKVLGMAFFVWVSVFNLFVVLVLWSFMTDIWSDLQARRLFPFIALGGTAGAIAGPCCRFWCYFGCIGSRIGSHRLSSGK